MLLYNNLLEWQNEHPEDELIIYKDKSYSVSDIFFEVETLSKAIYNIKQAEDEPIILFLKGLLFISKFKLYFEISFSNITKVSALGISKEISFINFDIIL